MARHPKHPEVKVLEVDGVAEIFDHTRSLTADVLRRRVDGYGKRQKRRYQVEALPASTTHIPGFRVTRLPDPEPQP